MYLELIYCPPGFTQNTDCYSSCQRNRDSSYRISNCTFESNIAMTVNPRSSSYYIGEGNSVQGLGRGGEMKVAIKGSTTNNSFIIEGCYFHNNTALWGGGLDVAYQDFPQNNTVVVRESQFVETVAIQMEVVVWM